MDDQIKQRIQCLADSLCMRNGDQAKDDKAYREAIRIFNSKPSFSASDLLTSLNRLKRALPRLAFGDSSTCDTQARRIDTLADELQSSGALTKLPELFEFLRTLANSSVPHIGDGWWHSLTDSQYNHSSSPESGFAITPADGPLNGVFPGIPASKHIGYPESRILLPVPSQIRRGAALCFVSERELVRDLLTVVQGFEGDLVKLTQDGCRYAAGKEVETWMREPGLRIGYLGWMCSKLKRLCTQKKNDSAGGLCSQKLYNVLQEELQLHRKNMALLDAKMHQNEPAGSSGDQIVGSDQLTLRKFDEAIFESRCRLHFLLTLFGAEMGVKGGQLIGILHKQAQLGDPEVRILGSKFIQAAVEPLLIQLRRWIFSGYLDDVFQEFFVVHEPTVPDDSFWTERYKLRDAMVPYFLTEDCARFVLMGGKSVAFIRNYCNMRTPIPGLEVYEEVENCTFGSADPVWDRGRSRLRPEATEDFLGACRVTTRYVVDLLRNTHNLTIHLLGLRKYFLMAQGDVILAVMDSLCESLNEPASHMMFTKNLTATLNMATSLYYEHPQILKSLDTIVISLGDNAEVGWEAFSLEYRIKGPLTNVLSQGILTRYKRIFAHLWRVKRADYLLAEMWRMEMCHRLETLRIRCAEFHTFFHNVRLSMHRMMQFVRKLQDCFDVEVLQIRWNEEAVRNSIDRCTSLDDVLTTHHDALCFIEERCYIRSSRPNLNLAVHLRVILDHVVQFDKMYDEMRELARCELTRLADDPRVVEDDLYLSRVPDLTNRVRNLHIRFKSEVSHFTALAEDLDPDSGTRCRLDFNHHYSKSDEKVRRQEALNVAGF